MNTRKLYRYRRSVRIQKNGTDTGDRYEYRKTVQFWKTVQVVISISSLSSKKE